jgi:hypothetical protein
MPNEIRRTITHDRLDAAEDLEIAPHELRARSLVAAADVGADARGRDVTLVGDAATDRLRAKRSSWVLSSQRFNAFEIEVEGVPRPVEEDHVNQDQGLTQYP